MTFKEFLRKQMSENGEPSNNRVMAFMFMTSVMIMLLAVVLSPFFQMPTIKLPEIPESFTSFVEWVLGILITGTAAGKLVNAYKDKGVASTTTTTATSTEVKNPNGTDTPAN